jgi:hypothetical protein
MELTQKNSSLGSRKNNHQKSLVLKFLVNNGLLVSGVLTTLSGLVLQLGFHMGSARQMHGDVHGVDYEQARGFQNRPDVWTLGYSDWSVLHKYAIVLLSLQMIIHIYLHINWYKAVITGNVFRKNRQVLILSVLFIFTAFSGLIPWFVDLLAGSGETRLGLIEIHDKLALVLIIYLVLHVARRLKWFGTTFLKLAGKK